MKNQNINHTYRENLSIKKASKIKVNQKKLNLLKQRLCGLLLLIVSFVVMSIVDEITAAFVIVPISLYLMITKEQILSFCNTTAKVHKKAVVVHDISRQEFDNEPLLLIHN